MAENGQIGQAVIQGNAPAFGPRVPLQFGSAQPGEEQSPAGKTGPAIFALYVSEDRCSEASPKQMET